MIAEIATEKIVDQLLTRMCLPVVVSIGYVGLVCKFFPAVHRIAREHEDIMLMFLVVLVGIILASIASVPTIIFKYCKLKNAVHNAEHRLDDYKTLEHEFAEITKRHEELQNRYADLEEKFKLETELVSDPDLGCMIQRSTGCKMCPSCYKDNKSRIALSMINGVLACPVCPFYIEPYQGKQPFKHSSQ